jgi:integrase
MNFCVSEEIIPANPVKAVKKPKLRLIRPNYSPTEDQLTKILNQLYPGARRFFLALVNSGCRLGEIQRANVGDVDWDAGTLRVIRKGGNLDFVPLESSVLRAVIKEELESRANPGPNDPLFVNQHGKRYLRITKSLTTACRIAKVPHCTHHSLRHAYANLLRKRRHDIVTISKLLGHANPAITLKVYSHWHDEEVRKAAATVAIGPELDQGAKIVEFKRRKRL